MSGLLVLGDAMLDRDIDGTVERICPEAPVPVLDETGRSSAPGGAARAAVIAAAAGREVTLLTALGDDEAGTAVRALAERAGVEVLDLGMHGATPEKIRLRSDDRTLLRLDRGGGPRTPLGEPDDGHLEALAGADAVLVSDYGRGMSSLARIRRTLARMAGRTPIVWDPHPRGRPPVERISLATPNRREAADLVSTVRGRGVRADAARARELRSRWQADGVAVTLGADGAVLDTGRPTPVMVPVRTPAHGDPCGAGDCFAAAAASALMAGSSTEDAVSAAVAAATRYVAGGGAGDLGVAPEAADDAAAGHGLRAAIEVSRRVRAEGGTVVATGGCFDLLHAGHVATLEAARQLGDCLIVLLNSDRSVSALKGPARPVVSELDRAALLESLRCVDAVVIFDDATPVRTLERLRPHIFAKGGDYSAEQLPETAAMRRWNGQTVILPTLEGRSTTRLIQRATAKEETA
ncbi:MAG TPA: PfkB family carbohydrate kinase [Gaiellales bacterium]|jgi:rfaE bifunctional protein nucleotidyltransferase chain/domain|nr:PfkB family carbohydrate kinase [Gaiellales bacterium]